MTVHSRVTIVTVSHDSLDVLPAMLDSIPHGTPTSIVDNASRDVAALRSLADGRGARLIESPVNEGFGAACNRGAKLATTEFLLFLNPDAVLAPGALEQLLAAADRYPLAVAMNPRLANADGAPSFKRNSDLMPRSERMARGWPTADCEVPVLCGAALFVRRKDFEAVCGFDPAIFLYHEDDDIARRLRAERGPLMFIRAALVTHVGGASSEQSTEADAFKAFHHARSRVYGRRKHRMALPFASTLHLGLYNLLKLSVLTSPHLRAVRWAYLRGGLSTWRDGGAMQESAE
ncbi:glycosyltransferase family 2 protein [Phaeovulum sp.]|uniref:glycosyltransferase family 2 protein n=1 Tax=Phaeovulum sp. TaxID=2934796 RepID=UPI00272FA501|nr:glycosyltransferase family 2 protein [Phaeovulum sp.]MDP1668936.1 glycosyltransferase family 2 protein [Phaeovulum sp.]MDZ4119207.1 glycosyltransferase family 2 protein [Phaeovulum sp.]